jgi:arginine decarboxylase-like protein
LRLHFVIIKLVNNKNKYRMGSLISIKIKGKDGVYKNYTISVSDETNEYGQNVSMYIEQSKEDRDAKKPRTYVGNGRVIWTDGNIQIAEKKEPAEVAQKSTPTQEDEENDLPY